MVMLGESDDGTRVTVAAGETVEVWLPETATTGYRWELDVDTGVLDVTGDDAVPPGDGRAGAPGRRHVVAVASRSGSGRLALTLRRSWEPPERAAQRYAVDVEVTP